MRGEQTKTPFRGYVRYDMLAKCDFPMRMASSNCRNANLIYISLVMRIGNIDLLYT
jgi:hypothetical protein